jgi:hypothetical protein
MALVVVEPEILIVNCNYLLTPYCNELLTP